MLRVSLDMLIIDDFSARGQWPAAKLTVGVVSSSFSRFS